MGGVWAAAETQTSMTAATSKSFRPRLFLSGSRADRFVILKRQSLTSLSFHCAPIFRVNLVTIFGDLKAPSLNCSVGMFFTTKPCVGDFMGNYELPVALIFHQGAFEVNHPMLTHRSATPSQSLNSFRLRSFLRGLFRFDPCSPGAIGNTNKQISRLAIERPANFIKNQSWLSRAFGARCA